VPSEWSSSSEDKEGITKRGDSRVRWLLVEAAWSILNRPRVDTAELRNWTLQIAVRRGKKVAVVALARRLAGILYAMLRDNKPYDPTRLSATPSRRRRSVAA
jgi:transposase